MQRMVFSFDAFGGHILEGAKVDKHVGDGLGVVVGLGSFSFDSVSLIFLTTSQITLDTELFAVAGLPPI